MDKAYKFIVLILLATTTTFAILCFIKLNNVYWDLDVVFSIASDNSWKLIQQDNKIEDIKSEIEFLENTLVHYE